MTIKSRLGFEKEDKFDLQKAIDFHLDSKQTTPRIRDYFYVTEVTKSKKELFDTLKKGSQFKINANLRKVFDNGDSVHERYARYFAEMGVLVASEIDINANDIVKGRLDCIITDGEKNYIVEIKSMNLWSFQKLTEPLNSHIFQLQFYLYFSNLENGMILYENKNTQINKIFPVKLDKPLVESKLKELTELKEMIDNDIEPEQEKLSVDELEYK